MWILSPPPGGFIIHQRNQTAHFSSPLCAVPPADPLCGSHPAKLPDGAQWVTAAACDSPLKTVGSGCQSQSRANSSWQTRLVSWNHNTDVLILAKATALKKCFCSEASTAERCPPSALRHQGVTHSVDVWLQRKGDANSCIWLCGSITCHRHSAWVKVTGSFLQDLPVFQFI